LTVTRSWKSSEEAAGQRRLCGMHLCWYVALSQQQSPGTNTLKMENVFFVL